MGSVLTVNVSMNW